MNYWNVENIVDLIFNIIGVSNFVLQQMYGPFILASKLHMMALVVIVLLKLVNILKIFSLLTPIVVMLKRVIYELRVFLFFFFFITFNFSLMTSVMGIGNLNIEGPFKEKYKDFDYLNPTDACGNRLKMPGMEYQKIGLLVGNFFQIMRVGIGDFAILNLVGFLNVPETIIFWLVWYMAVLVSTVIFLNLIVAEASQSYSKVTETLELVIEQERAALISDSEIIAFNQTKNQNKYPKYIVVR